MKRVFLLVDGSNFFFKFKELRLGRYESFEKGGSGMSVVGVGDLVTREHLLVAAEMN